MTELTASHFANVAKHPASHKVMDDHFRSEAAHFLTEAKKQVEDKVRGDWCDTFDIKREENSDDEGGGSVRLEFPAERGWTEELATQFASNILSLDLGTRYGGPGRYFQDSGAFTRDDGAVLISVSWGLDI